MQGLARYTGAATVCCTLLLVCTSLAAQTHDVLQQKDVTPNALIDALTPPAAAPADAATEAAPSRTRSFKVTKNQPSSSATPAKPASASLMITFETESAKLTGDSKHLLDNLAIALNSEKLAKLKFSIEGHADSRGSAEKNMALSRERAQAVRQHLISQSKIDPTRLSAVGKGDTEQLNPDNPAAPENRRVRIVTLTE